MKPNVLAVIPARLASTRLPGKALYPIDGKPLLEHLYKEVSRAGLIDRTIVASDSTEIIQAVERFGGQTLKTSKKHRTGSDRTAEAAQRLGGDIIINIQADHLGLKAREFDKVIQAMLSDKSIKYATFIKRIETESELYDPHRVKVIFDKDNNAIWFSRYPIPYLQGVSGNRVKEFNFYYHIGVYFYRKEALAAFHNYQRTSYEKAESLEQLRILENGGKMRVYKTKCRIWSIDSPKDLILHLHSGSKKQKIF